MPSRCVLATYPSNAAECDVPPLHSVLRSGTLISLVSQHMSYCTALGHHNEHAVTNTLADVCSNGSRTHLSFVARPQPPRPRYFAAVSVRTRRVHYAPSSHAVPPMPRSPRWHTARQHRIPWPWQPPSPVVDMSINCIGHNYIDHNYIDHNYRPPSSVIDMSINCIGHNSIDHNNMDHNYIDDNYRPPSPVIDMSIDMCTDPRAVSVQARHCHCGCQTVHCHHCHYCHYCHHCHYCHCCHYTVIVNGIVNP